MKILWIVNTIFPYPAKKMGQPQNVLGGWLIGLFNELIKKDNIELAVATVYNGKEIKEFKDEKVTYYLIPGAPAIKYNKKLEKYWKIINEKVKPELVHIHGTEYTHGLAFKNACPNTKVITSIQGLISRIAQKYYADMPLKLILKNITIRDIIKNGTIIHEKWNFAQRGNYEIDLIKKSEAIIGRTFWDYANIMGISKNVKYYIGNEILRAKFYEANWKLENIERHSIFISQATYPIKGLHILLEAIKIVKERYSDVILYIAGMDITNRGFLTTGYGQYIKNLIKKYGLEKNVVFTGTLTEEQMRDRLLKSNIFILPSTIENSSNSLGEAMMLGMPCIATNTGGTMDMLEHKKEGYLYSYTDSAVCAEYIHKFFEDDNLCIALGKEAQKTARKRHNVENNVEDIIKIYNNESRCNDKGEE